MILKTKKKKIEEMKNLKVKIMIFLKLRRNSNILRVPEELARKVMKRMERNRGTESLLEASRARKRAFHYSKKELNESLIKRMNKKDSSKVEEIKQESKDEVKEEDKDEENTRKRKQASKDPFSFSDLQKGPFVVPEEVLRSSSYEKVVKIPLEGDEILRVHGKRTQGVVKTLLNTKSSVKDKILATPSETSKANVVIDALRRKERVKPRRVRAMAMTIQYGVRGMILAAQSEAFKQENLYKRFQDVKLARIHIDEIIARNGILVTLKLRFRWVNYLVVLADAAESVSDAIRFEYCLASSSGWTNIQCAPFKALYGRKHRSHILWAEIRRSSLIGPELVLETTDKVVGDRVLLRVSPWKGVVHFGKKGKLALRYVGPFEILKRISLVAYRLRLPEELNSVNDTFHVSNLKKCLADASLHVPLDEIKVDKTLRFIEEPVEIMDREIKSLKCSKMSLVKVRWNSKRCPEFTWEHEDYMKAKYPQLFVDRADESTS
ncbi:hypothetical protein Tco_0517022 [Tanacetum coccineum]